MASQGHIALANFLNAVNNAKRNQGVDKDLEYRLLLCFKQAANNKVSCDALQSMGTALTYQAGAADILGNPSIITQLTQSLRSPHILCRKLTLDLLNFFLSHDADASRQTALKAVLKGFETIETLENELIADPNRKVGKFDRWLQQVIQVMDSRGRMGSQVNAGEDDKVVYNYTVRHQLFGIRRKCVLADIQISSLFLANNMLAAAFDLRLRMALRTQLEASDMLSIFSRARQWRLEDDVALRNQINTYHAESKKDQEEFTQQHNGTLMRNMGTPEDVIRNLLMSLQKTKAMGHFLVILKAFLLIQGDERDRIFQLYSQIAWAVTMHGIADVGYDFSRAFGISVTHLIGKFVEQERIEAAETKIKQLEFELLESRQQKAELDRELHSDSLVGELKTDIDELKDKLSKSRQATDSLKDQMEGMKKDHAVRVGELDQIITMLFALLMESGHLDLLAKKNPDPDREALLDDLKRRWELDKTIRTLEGREEGGVLAGAKNKAEVERLKVQQEEQRQRAGRSRDGMLLSPSGMEVQDSGRGVGLRSDSSQAGPSTLRSPPVTAPPRISVHRDSNQFLDAADDDVRAHIEHSLVLNADKIVSALRHRAHPF